MLRSPFSRCERLCSLGLSLSADSTRLFSCFLFGSSDGGVTDTDIEVAPRPRRETTLLYAVGRIHCTLVRIRFASRERDARASFPTLDSLFSLSPYPVCLCFFLLFSPPRVRLPQSPARSSVRAALRTFVRSVTDWALAASASSTIAGGWPGASTHYRRPAAPPAAGFPRVREERRAKVRGVTAGGATPAADGAERPLGGVSSFVENSAVRRFHRTGSVGMILVDRPRRSCPDETGNAPTEVEERGKHG